MFDEHSTACFTGYRPKKYDYFNKASLEPVSVRLALSIFTLIDGGYDTFLFGGAPGLDILAARAVRYAQVVKNSIRLVCVLPYKDFHLSREFNDVWREKYLKILPHCHEVITLADRYYSSCYMDRNIYMVDHSSHLIALYDGAPGGTRNTIEYARKQGESITNILDYPV